MSRRFVVSLGTVRSFMPPHCEGTPNTKVITEAEVEEFFGEHIEQRVLDRFALDVPAPKPRGRRKKADTEETPEPSSVIDPFAS